MSIRDALIDEQNRNLEHGDSRAFRYSPLTKAFWTEVYLQGGAYSHV